jgi:tRNA U34 5-carboxymethylaminomethyl modifying GTPase MnmE/TrmE
VGQLAQGKHGHKSITKTSYYAVAKFSGEKSTAMDLLGAGDPPELVAVELRTALGAVGEVVGEAGTEEILGKIFSSFCIGK